jgi:hypothetical protein
MVVEQKSCLPFVDTFPVQVQVSILARGNGYDMYISAYQGMFHRFHIALSPDDVAELNTELQGTIEGVAGDFTKEGVPREALLMLAEKGNFAFKKIFADSELRKLLSNVLKMDAVVQITSENFFVPWELLYDGSVDDSFDIYRFWGMRAIISRSIIQDDRPGDFVSPIIQTQCPHVGLIAYRNLEHVAKKEIPLLQKLHESKQIELSFLQAMDAGQRAKELAGFAQFLNKDLQIVHLACHAYEQKPISQSYLLVSDYFSITMQDFIVREFEIKYNPFVILNACLTGTINPLQTYSWAAEFWKRGARGVLATEFHVPDWFGAAFVEELYRYLLAGKPVGEAVAATRRSFWEKHRNPLGLAYALYSSPEIRIANSD